MRSSHHFLIAALSSQTTSFENAKKLIIVGFGMFVFFTLFIVFPRNRPLPSRHGNNRGVINVALWGRWICLAVGLYGVLKLFA
jgi:hypothetical protein